MTTSSVSDLPDDRCGQAKPRESAHEIGRLFGEVFDLVDEAVERITDAEVDERLRELLTHEADGDDDASE